MSYVSEKPCECPVCFETLKDELKPLSCGHWVHKECVIKSKKDNCPMCRQKVNLSLEERLRINDLQINDTVSSNFEYTSIVYDEEEREFIEMPAEEYLMPSEQFIVQFNASSFYNYDNVAIMYDGRFVTKIGNIFKYAFTDEFEAMNFCYTVEQEYGVIEGSVCLTDRSQPNNIIRSGEIMVDV